MGSVPASNKLLDVKQKKMRELISLWGMVSKLPFRYEISSSFFYDFNWVKIECKSLGRACMGHMINIQQICCKRGNIENIFELTMMDFNRTSPNRWDLGVISYMNARSSWYSESGEGFLGGNHVVGCSIIYQISF